MNANESGNGRRSKHRRLSDRLSTCIDNGIHPVANKVEGELEDEDECGVELQDNQAEEEDVSEKEDKKALVFEEEDDLPDNEEDDVVKAAEGNAAAADDDDDFYRFRMSEANPEYARAKAAISEQQEKPRILTDADYLPQYLQRLAVRRAHVHETGMVGVPTGLKTLDAAMGGLQGITIIAGNTGSGKTSLAMQCCIAALRADPALAVTYVLFDEMSVDDLLDQTICHTARIDYRRYVDDQLTPAERKRAQEAMDWLQKHIRPRMRTTKLAPGNTGSLGMDLCQDAFRLANQVGARRLLTVVDMFDDMHPPPVTDGDHHGEPSPAFNGIDVLGDRWRLQQLLELHSLLQKGCRYDCPILVLGKLRKPLFRQDEPELPDLKGSVDLAYKAKRVIFLLPDQNAPADSDTVPVTLAIKKARHGRMVRLPLTFHHPRFIFEENNLCSGGGKQRKQRPQPGDAAPAVAQPADLIDPFAGLEG